MHNYQTRNRENVVPVFRRLARTRSGTAHHCIMFYNKLPLKVRNLNSPLYKRKIKDYLVEGTFYSVNDYLESNFNFN